MRLPTNPGQLPTTTPTLPSRLASACAAAIVSGVVVAPRTISTSRITLAGLKKCVPMTACGRVVTPASASMSSVDVLVASSAPGRATASSCASTSFLSAMLSNTASMITSALSKPRVPHLCRDPADALGRRLGREAPLLHRAVVVLADGGHRPVEAGLLGVGEHDGDAGVGARHGDAAAHRAGADDRDRGDRRHRRCPCRRPGTLATARSAKNA